MSSLLDKLAMHEKYQEVFGSPAGQEVLMHIMKAGFVFKPTFVRGDVNETMLNEGSRRLALSILKIYGKDHAIIQKMMEQQQQT